jgi:hypothetical protein
MNNDINLRFTNKQYRFYNFPERLRPEDYQRTEEAIVAHLRKKKEVVSIYRLGMAKHPGISDLDIVYVADAVDGRNHQECLNLRGVKGVDPRVLTHPIFPLNRFCFENMQHCFYISHIEHLAGEKIALRQLSESEEMLKSFSGLVGSVAHILDLFSRLKERQDFNVRKTLMRLYAVRYDIASLRSLRNEENSGWDAFNQKSFSLREKWFSLEDKKRISLMLELCDQAVTIYQDIITSLGGVIREKGFESAVPLEQKDYFLRGGNNRLFIFSDRLWERGQGPLAYPRCISAPAFFPWEVRQAVLRTHCHPVILPKNFILYFYFLSRFEGEFSWLLRQKIWPQLREGARNFQIPFQEVFRRQGEVYNNHWSYLIRCHIDMSLFVLADWFREHDFAHSVKQKLFRDTAERLLRKIHYDAVVFQARSM